MQHLPFFVRHARRDLLEEGGRRKADQAAEQFQGTHEHCRGGRHANLPLRLALLFILREVQSARCYGL
jgi:hypothetical protein